MRRLFVLISVCCSVWKAIQRARRNSFLETLKTAQASLAAAVFQTQGSRSDSSCSQHLPRARDLARLSRKSSRFKSSRRTLTRDTSARDWTSSDAAAQAASGALPAGFQRHTVTLPATVAIEPCNKTIPVTLLWHESMLPGGLAQHPPPVATAATDTATATDTGVTPTQVPTAAPEAGEGAGGAQEGVRKLPVVIWLHATGQCATDMVPRMEVFARHGFLTVAVDARYHGERTDPCSSCAPREQYENAVYRAWHSGAERPFLLDNVRDLSVVLDYLTGHPNVDPERIGMAGVSLGGMHTWLCAAIDGRVTAAAPMIGVHSFQWQLSNNAFHGRVDSLRNAFKQICNDCGKEAADAAVVQNVWHRLLPGMLEDYDAAKSLPCIAPRPLLIVNGEHDPRCRIEGVEEVFSECRKAYRHWGCEGNLEMVIDAGAYHEVTAEMDQAVERFFVKHLLNV